MKAAKLFSGMLILFCAAAASAAPAEHAQPADYVLGPDDKITVWALGFEEIPDRPIPIDPAGNLDLPSVGRVHAAGLTTRQLEEELTRRMASQVRQPRVSLHVVEFGSQPVSIVGAVSNPGVQQVRGRKTLIEILSLAGGLRADAGPVAKITRRSAQGSIPLPGARVAQNGEFSVAEVSLNSLLAAQRPEQNIPVQPYDVITIPTAELIYVMGAVRKPGAFPLRDKGQLSVLQALSMAEGLGVAPSPQNAKILRASDPAVQRQEIRVDLKKVLAGKDEDVGLRPNDILFVPTSGAKKASSRVVEAMIQTLTGVVVWRGIP